MAGVISKVLRLFSPQTLGRSSCQRRLRSAINKIQMNGCSTLATSTENAHGIVSMNEHEPLTVWSCNEWDPLKEVVVGRAEGQRVPTLFPELKASIGQEFWKSVEENAGKPHDPVVVQKAIKEVEEFCRILEFEGVVVKRPDPIRWDELGTFRTPYFEEGGYMNACPRDGLMVVGDEIIEASMAMQSRVFEFYSYKKLLNEYFHKGAKWTSAPRPAMGEDLLFKDYPFEDMEKRLELTYDGQFILTESEIAFDAADAMRFGRDIFVSLGHATNRSGVEWLRRHLKPRGIDVHSFIYAGTDNCHADTTLIPLRPGLLIVNPTHPCLKINDEPAGWEYFSKRGWDVVEVPPPMTIDDMAYVSKWIHMNVLSLDTERVFMQKGEEPLRKLFVDLGMKPIEVDMRNAFELGGAFHCWTLDIRRTGSMEKYL